MKQIIKILVVMALILNPGTNLFAAMDFMVEESLAKSLDRMENLYKHHDWDEAMEVGRGILRDSPPNTPIRNRAQDLILLSVQGKNTDAMKQMAIQKKNQRIEKAKSSLEKGQKYLTEKKYSTAISYLVKSVRNNAGDSKAYYLLGYALLKRGDKHRAYKAFKKCLKLNPKHSRALFNITGLSYKFNYTDEAERYSRKLIKTIDNRIEELKEIFIEQKGQRLNDKAIATSKKIAGLKINLEQALYMHGILSERKGNYKDATNSFKRATELKPTSADNWYHFGKCLLKRKIFHQASIALKQAILISENKLKELKNLAGKLLDDGKADAAVSAELKTKKLKKQIANYLYVLAIANGKKKETETAIRNLSRAIELKPDFIKAKYARAIYYAEKTKFDKAISEMRSILKSATPNGKLAKKTIKSITFLMGMKTRRENPTIARIVESKSRQKKVNEYVKDMDGLGGKKQERVWENIFPVLKNVQELVSMRNYPEAIRRLLYLRTKHPEVADIHAILGECYMEEGRFKDAAECFKRTIAINPRQADALSNLAYVYASMDEKLDKALVLAKKAVGINGFKPQFMHTLGWVLFKTGEVKKSIAAFQKAIELKPDYILAHYNLGLSYYISKNYTSALDEFDTVLTKTPTHQKALLFKSLSLAKLKNVTDALKTLEKLRSILPKKAILAKVVGDLHAKLKLAEERHTELPLPKIKSPAPIEKLMAEAADFRSKGLVTHAKEKYLECQRLAPERYEPYYQLGDMYARAGLNKPALSTWKKCESINPNDYNLQLHMGMVLHKLSRNNEARQHFVKAQGLDEKASEPKYYLGLIAYEERRFDSAESHALGALRLKPRFFKAMALLGMARMKLGRLKPARDIYEELYAKAPSGSTIKSLARKQLWTITRQMAPAAYPSVEDAKDITKQMVRKNKGEKAYKPDPSELPAFKEYGKNTMTPDNKLWVLKNMSKFSNVPMPALAAPLKKVVTKEAMSSPNKKWVIKHLSEFDSQKNKYSLPAHAKKQKYTLKTSVVKERKPDASDEANLLGLSYAEKGFMPKALEEFEKARKISPKNLDVLINIGYVNTITGNFKNAFDAFAQAVAYHPFSPLARLALGNLYWLGGKGEKAIEQWKYINNKIVIDKKFTYLARAEKIWKRMLEVQPTEIDAHSNLGLVYMFSGKFKEAIAEFRAVTALAPNRKEHEFYSAQAYVIMYLSNKNRSFKKKAKTILTALKKGLEPFPHSKTLENFVRTL